MINLNMQKDIDYDAMTTEERERLVGPERLLSLHRALKEIGVSYCTCSIFVRYIPLIVSSFISLAFFASLIEFAES